MAEQPKKKTSVLMTLMKLGLLLFLLMLGSCVGIWAYGKSTPEAHTASGSAVIKADIDDVFALEADAKKAPDWNGISAEIRDYTENPDGTASWIDVRKDGNEFGMKRTAYINEKLIRVEISDKAEIFSGSWTFDFEEVEGGTKVTITENGNIPNAFYRGMYNLVGDPEYYLKEHLSRMETYFAGKAD